MRYLQVDVTHYRARFVVVRTRFEIRLRTFVCSVSSQVHSDLTDSAGGTYYMNTGLCPHVIGRKGLSGHGF